jgi:DICT domain-containing protein
MTAPDRVPDGDRRFETIWTTEPGAVRAASEIAWRLARDALPSLPATPEAFQRPAHELPGGTRRVVDLANRMLAYAAS